MHLARNKWVTLECYILVILHYPVFFGLLHSGVVLILTIPLMQRDGDFPYF